MHPIWVAVLEDGGVLVEGEGRTWDDVPRDARIRSLQLRDLRGGATLASLDGFVGFYVYNEAAAATGRQGVPTAKVIGGVRADGTVREVRLAYEWQHSDLTAPGVVPSGLREGTG